MRKDVSIIIPSYNSAITITETLESVLSQTHTYWECLVVDDGSADTTDKVVNGFVKKDSRISFYKRPQHQPKGANACRNFGIEQSQGDFVMFLDSDDVITPSCLEGRIALLNLKPQFDLVVANTALLVNHDFNNKAINNDPKLCTSESYLLKFLSYELPWTIMSGLWKREIVTSNSFDETLFRFQDVDFHIKILKSNYNIGRLHTIDNYYRIDQTKPKDERYIKTVLDNLHLFFDKHINFVNSNSAYQCAFQKFVNHFLFYYIFPNYRAFKTEATLILKQVYSSGLYSNKQLAFIKTYAFLVKTKLTATKFLGMYTFSNFIKRKLENS